MLATTTTKRAMAVRLAVTAVAVGVAGSARGQVHFDGGSTTTPTYLSVGANWEANATPGATGEGVLDNSLITLPSTLHFGTGTAIGALTLNSPTLTQVLSSPNAGALLNVSFGGATRDGAALPLVNVGESSADAVAIKDTATQGINFILTTSGVFNVTNATQNLTIQASLINKSGVTASIEKTGAGTLTLVRPDTALSANGSNYGGTGGTVTITGGTLSVSDNNNLGNTANKVVLNGGTFQYLNAAATANASTARTFQVAAPSTIDVTLPGAFSYTISGPLTGSGTLTKTGTSELILSSGAGTFNGALQVNTGSLRLLNPAAVATGTTVKLVGLNSTLNLRRDGGGSFTNVSVDATTKNGQVFVDRQSSAGGLFTIGDVTLGGVTLNLNGNSANGNSLAVNNVTLSGNGTIQTSAIPVSMNGTIGEAGGAHSLKKMGAATLTLMQASTFTGGVIVGGGTLEVSGDGQLGAAGASGLAPVTVATDYSPTTPSPATLKVAGSYATNRPVVAGDGTIDNASDVTLGAVTGSGSLVKSGAGKLTVPSIVGGGLSVGDGTFELAAGRGTSKLASFGHAFGKLDVTNNKVVFSGPAAGSVRGWLSSGGIVSATAQADSTGTTGVGYLTVGATELDVTTWGGLDVAAGDVVTKLTYTGDINLDGKVNADDFALMDRGLARGLAVGMALWVDGDVNYDGAVTPADFMLADKAFARHGGVLSPDFLADRDARFGDAYVSELVAAVPEPTVGGLAAVVGAAMSLGGRRRQRRAE